MMLDDAPGRRADEPVMARNVACNSTNSGTFQTPLCNASGRVCERRNSNRDGDQSFVHFKVLLRLQIETDFASIGMHRLIA